MLYYLYKNTLLLYTPCVRLFNTEGVDFRFHVLCSRTRFRRYRGRRVPYSCFALPESFSAVSRASSPFFMFSATGLIFGGIEGVGSRFHVLCSRTCFGGTEGIGSHFNVLRSRTRFRRYIVRRVPLSCFTFPDSFSTVLRVSGQFFMFCAIRLVFSGTEVVESHFHVLRSRTRFRQYRGRPVPISRFALPIMFLAVPRVLGPVLMFCAPGLVFGGAESVRSHFHVLGARTRFRHYRGRRVPFSSFALPESFSAVPRASGPVFKFCAPGLDFGGTEVVLSRFHVFCSRTRFWRYRGRRVPFSCFALPDMFLAILRVSGPFFMFCASGLVFDGTEGVGSLFHVLRSGIRFRRYRGRRDPFSCLALPDSFSAVPRVSGPIFIFCAPGLIFVGAECVRSRFHVLRSRTPYRWCRGRQVPCSCFALPGSFSAIPRASGPFFMFCATGLVIGGTEGVGSCFHVLRSRTRFRRC
jgi:hypothetical protein